MKRIDAHQHFWKLSRGDYSWLTPKLEELYRDYLPVDIKDELASANVSETVLVQAADTVEETEFMLLQADNHKFVSGVVGWVNMEDSAALHQLSCFMENPFFKGVRPMIQDIDDASWMLKPELTPVFKFMEENELTFDALVLPKHLANLQMLLSSHPKLRVVIDHGGKPEIAKALGKNIMLSVNKGWAKDMQQLGKNKNVYCKLSGLNTEAGIDATYADIERYMSYLLDCFGANHLMWGSDWPVVNLTSNYSGWLDMVTKFTQALTKSEQERIWSGTAKEFYQL